MWGMHRGSSRKKQKSGNWSYFKPPRSLTRDVTLTWRVRFQHHIRQPLRGGRSGIHTLDWSVWVMCLVCWKAGSFDLPTEAKAGFTVVSRRFTEVAQRRFRFTFTWVSDVSRSLHSRMLLLTLSCFTRPTVSYNKMSLCLIIKQETTAVWPLSQSERKICSVQHLLPNSNCHQNMGKHRWPITVLAAPTWDLCWGSDPDVYLYFQRLHLCSAVAWIQL